MHQEKARAVGQADEAEMQSKWTLDNAGQNIVEQLAEITELRRFDL